MTQRDPYFLGQSDDEQERLKKQAEVLAQDASELFDLIGIAPGWRVVELGCGPRGCLDLLSRRVAAKGSVVGVEIDKEAVEHARSYLAAAGIKNAEVRQGDATATGLVPGSFDMAMARLLMINIPKPERVIAEMVTLVKPGGVVAFQEGDWGLQVSEPPSPALEHLLGVFETYARRNGMDMFVGRKLPRWLKAVGLNDVQVRPIVRAYSVDSPQRTFLVQFVDNLRDRILGEGLISERELNQSVAALKRHLSDPDVLLLFPLMIQAWGRKPLQ